jgi:Uma2 family endonuclease
MVASKKPATYEDLMQVPEHQVAEIVNGELVVSPRPASRHANASSRLGVALGPFDRDPGGDEPGGWLFLDEPELHLGAGGRQVVVPDLAGWRRERLPELPDAPWIDIVPDWLCEVASPSTARHDSIVKSAIYLDAGVRWLWLVTPLTETIEVFEKSPDQARWTLVTTAVGPEPRRLAPFEALTLDVARLWSLR